MAAADDDDGGDCTTTAEDARRADVGRTDAAPPLSCWPPGKIWHIPTEAGSAAAAEQIWGTARPRMERRKTERKEGRIGRTSARVG